MATETMQMYWIENSSKMSAWQNLQKQLQAFKMQTNKIGNLFCYNFQIFTATATLDIVEQKQKRAQAL